MNSSIEKSPGKNLDKIFTKNKEKIQQNSKKIKKQKIEKKNQNFEKKNMMQLPKNAYFEEKLACEFMKSDGEANNNHFIHLASSSKHQYNEDLSLRDYLEEYEVIGESGNEVFWKKENSEEKYERVLEEKLEEDEDFKDSCQ